MWGWEGGGCGRAHARVCVLLNTHSHTRARACVCVSELSSFAVSIFTAWVLVSVIAVFWATIPNPTRPRVADSGTPYRYIG